MPLWTLIGLLKGRATTKWPKKKDQHGQQNVLGFPRYDETSCQDNCSACVDVCLSKAIARNEPTAAINLDYGRCIQCQLCIEVCPTGALTDSHEWALGVRQREDLILRHPFEACHPLEGGDPGFVHWIPASAGMTKSAGKTRLFKRSLHIRHVDAGSCNGCESELQALDNPFYSLDRFGIFFTPSPRFADLLLVTGPVTKHMKESLLEAYQAMPEPRFVMAVGTCAVSGGISGGGDHCEHGLEGVLPVDVYLPGCPPNPAAIISALLMFQERMPAHILSAGRI